MELWAFIHCFHRVQCKILDVFCHTQCPVFCTLFCTLNLNKIAFISNGNKRKSRFVFQGNEINGHFLSFCRLLTRARFGCSLRAIVMRAMKVCTCIARHIVQQCSKFQNDRSRNNGEIHCCFQYGNTGFKNGNHPD